MVVLVFLPSYQTPRPPHLISLIQHSGEPGSCFFKLVGVVHQFIFLKNPDSFFQSFHSSIQFSMNLYSLNFLFRKYIFSHFQQSQTTLNFYSYINLRFEAILRFLGPEYFLECYIDSGIPLYLFYNYCASHFAILDFNHGVNHCHPPVKNATTFSF